VIKSESGKDIVVDKVKVEGKEKILRRGEVSETSDDAQVALIPPCRRYTSVWSERYTLRRSS
jgi:hypothetical protein